MLGMLKTVTQRAGSLAQRRKRGGSDGDGSEWDQWGSVLAEAETLSQRGRSFKSLLCLLEAELQSGGGIPGPIRGRLWQELCGVHASTSANLAGKYVQLLKQNALDEEQILKDVHRTLPSHHSFQEERGQQSLFNVVKCYALYDPQVGYCQGLANIAATLLLQMDEDSAFATLVKMMESPGRYAFREQYTPGMPLLQLRLWQLEKLLMCHKPHLADYLDKLGIAPTTYASEWFLTLFAYKWPVEFVSRVWDLIMCHGVLAVFAMAIAALCEAEQESCAQGGTMLLGFEPMVNLLRQQIPCRCGENPALADRLIDTAIEILPKLGDKQLQRLEREYRQLHCAKQVAATAAATPQAPAEDIGAMTREVERAGRVAREKSSRLAKKLEQLQEPKGTIEHWRSLVVQAADEEQQGAYAVATAMQHLSMTERLLESAQSGLQSRLSERQRLLLLIPDSM